jgi:hypothetical protein
MKKFHVIIGVVIVVALIILVFWVKSALKSNYLELGSNETIDPTPTQIQSIRDIGEWEFLSISAEEMVDTIRKGFFTDDELVRIYYGTLRLGIDMKSLADDAISVKRDSVEVVLPKIGLLDKDFIDEAKTKSFYESGRWNSQAHEALYRKAQRQMLHNCLTPANLEAAQTNAEAQFRSFMISLGYQNVSIRFK